MSDEPLKRGRGRPATGQKVVVLSMRGDPLWRTWLEECANAEGITTSQFVESAVAERAARRKLRKPPPR